MKKISPAVVVLSILALLSSACVFSQLLAPAPAEPVGLVETSAAKTANAVLTQSVIETALSHLTATPAISEPTRMATATLAPSSTPLTPSPTPTRRPPTSTPLPPTATPLPCNVAQFIADITIPDGEIMETSKPFTKIWGLKNVGSCIWTEDFTVVFASGDPMSAPEFTVLPKVVLPGEYVNVAVDMKVPDQPGSYIGHYQLKTDEGVPFGIGANAQKTFWVRINVIQPGNKPGIVFDLTKDYCAAEWKSGALDTLPCPSSPNDPNGAVFRMTNPRLENGVVENEPAIIMNPSTGAKGFAEGTFPAINIRAGNRFTAIIGCLANSDACSVTFQLDYIADGGEIRSLGSWPQVNDRKWKKLDIDLSLLAGKSVNLILRVLNNGDATEDRAFWLSPKVHR